MAIPTSNKPGGGSKSKTKVDNTTKEKKRKPAAPPEKGSTALIPVDPEALGEKKEAELTKVIDQVRSKAGILKDKQDKLEGNKVELMYDIGSKVNKIIDGLTSSQTAAAKRRFSEATAIGTAFVSNCIRFSTLYTKDDLKEILTVGLNTKIVWVLVTVEEDSDRKKLLKLALTNKYDQDDLRAEASKMKLRRVEASGDPTKATKIKKKNFDRAMDKGINAVSGLSDIFNDISDITDTFDPELNKEIVEKAIDKLNAAEDIINNFRNKLEELLGVGE